MSIRRFLAIVAFMVVPAIGAAFSSSDVTSGTVTLTNSNIMGGQVIIRSFACVSDAYGDVVFDTDGVDGELVKLVFDPGATTPSNNWDMTLADADSATIYTNTDISNSTTLVIAPDMNDSGGSNAFRPWINAGDITVTGANIGNAKTVTLKIYVRTRY